MGQRWLDGYSAQVEIYVLIDGKRFDVAQIGRGSLILRDVCSLASTPAVLVMIIDGHEERESVFLAKNRATKEDNRQERMQFI